MLRSFHLNQRDDTTWDLYLIEFGEDALQDAADGENGTHSHTAPDPVLLVRGSRQQVLARLYEAFQ
jgi:hypothetical protein